VGVGILGKEGAHAAVSSDFVVHRFKHLERLLFVHGRYSLLRSSKVVLFSLYKNLCFALCQFWFSVFSAFSGQTLFDGFFMTLFNIFFTSLPPFAVGFFEQDIPIAVVARYPFAYADFKKSDVFQMGRFMQFTFSAVVHSIFLFFFAYGTFSQTSTLDPAGRDFDLWAFGMIVFSVTLIVLNWTMLLEMNNWTAFNIAAPIVGYLVYLFVSGVYCQLPTYDAEIYYVFQMTYGTGYTYFYLILAVVSCTTIDITRKYLQRQLWPQTWHILQERAFKMAKLSRTPSYSISRLRDLDESKPK